MARAPAPHYRWPMRPVLLDLTRLCSRAGRTLTGVDRVELAYAEGLAGLGVPLHGLVRTSLGFLLLDGPGMGAVARAARDRSWPTPDLLARLSRLPDAQARGQSLARALAVARAPRWGLPRLFRHLPPGMAGLNVGHSNLGARALAAARALGPVAVMIHDTIPLDLPQHQRAGTPEAFRRKLAAVARHATLVLSPSEAAAGDVRRHMARLALRPPPVHALPLGVAVAPPDPALLPPGLPPPPFFVTLGTVEPRKNHALLLDVWEGWPEAPPLLLLGSRGWGNEAVFRRLDARPRGVVELSGLPDGAVSALLQRAEALLAPSLAEGFGLPSQEALALGCPVICGDLAVFRETLGDRAVMCRTFEPGEWRAAIEALLGAPPPRSPKAPAGWPGHLKDLLTILAERGGGDAGESVEAWASGRPIA